MLESFFEQEYLGESDYELIIVDNNSRDETRSVVDKYPNPNLRYVFEQRQGLNIARNRGVAESKGDIVAFLDDDVIVDKKWLKNLKGCFEETKADAVGGRAYLIFEKEPPNWLGPEFRIFLSQVDFGDRRQFLSNGSGLWGLNLSFRRSAIEAAGGFDEKIDRCGSQMLSGGDTCLLGKIIFFGKKIVYEPEAVVGHMISSKRLEWEYFVAHAIGIGQTQALCDTRCKKGYQIMRVGNALKMYLGSTFNLLKTNLTGESICEKKLAKWKVIKERSFFAARWKELWC